MKVEKLGLYNFNISSISFDAAKIIPQLSEI